jgi:predicted enzyme related to lactoylglutathione lyase
MATEIAGFVFRSSDRHATAKFYEALGLNTDEHSHGGPMHYGILSFSLESILEVYQSSRDFFKDSIMIYVDSIESALSKVGQFESELIGKIKDTDNMRFVYTTDPDNRSVMLIERKK